MFNRIFFPALLLVGALALPLASCKDDDDDAATPTPEVTLYEKLGKFEGVKGVVDQFLVNVVTETSTPNSKLKRTFQPLLDEVAASGASSAFEVPRVILLEHNLIDQIGQAAGGPLIYKGKDMTTAHTGMRITDDEFNALVAALSQACDTKNVAAADKATLLGVLGGMKGAIVNK